MITPMSKIQLTGLKSDKQDLISFLHNLGILQIEVTSLNEITLQRGLKQSVLTEEEERARHVLEEAIKKTEEILAQIKVNYLGDINELCFGLEKLSNIQIEIRVNDIETRLKSILEEKNKFKEEALVLCEYKKIIGAFLKSDYVLSRYENLECVALVFPKKFMDEMKYFQQRIEAKIKHPIDVYLSDFGRKKVCALVFYDKKFSQDIDAEIFKKGTQKLTLPQEYLGKPFKESFDLIELREKAIQEFLQNCEKNIELLAKENFCFLRAVKLVAYDRLDELIAELKFVETEYTVTLTGWLPQKRYPETKNSLEEKFGKRIIVNDITKTVKHREEMPVLLDNPQAAQPFELLLSFLQPPKYGTFDPTRLLSVFFPLFFGLIVGDIGYGLVLLIVSLLLKRIKNPLVKDISKLISYVSVSSIVFGILFAEFFGELGSKVLGMHPLLFHRQKDIVPFLILAVSIGAAHIILGLILGIIEALKQKHRKEALGKGSIILSLFGLFFLVAILSDILPKGFLVPSVALLLISLPILIMVKGFLGPLEIFSTASNILSYARIMALGVAGVMIAHIANTFGGMIENVILGIMVASLIHILNIILSVFSPTIQSLRLHYVEFFSKFYEPGGKKYVPFKKIGGVGWIC